MTSTSTDVEWHYSIKIVLLIAQIITTGEENFSIDAYQELVYEYGYLLLTCDLQDSILVGELMKTCINDRIMSQTKYRLSQSQEYFVPNKTQHQDVVQFIKVGLSQTCLNN